MKRIAFYLSLVLVVLVLASCKKGQKNLFTPTSSGRPYEVLVVVNKPVWDRPAGRALFDVLVGNLSGGRAVVTAALRGGAGRQDKGGEAHRQKPHVEF